MRRAGVRSTYIIYAWCIGGRTVRRCQVDFWVIQSDAASILPSIISLCKGVLDRTLRFLDLQGGSVLSSGAQDMTALRCHTALSLFRASASPYRFPTLFRSCACVAMTFRSLQHFHQRACRSSNDLHRNSSTVHDRPRRGARQTQRSTLRTDNFIPCSLSSFGVDKVVLCSLKKPHSP